MTTKYEQGREAEYRICRELELLGYQTARLAGSHGAADVIAWNANEIRYIQAKTWKTRRGSYKEDVKKLDDLILPPFATAELWDRQVGQRGWHAQTKYRTTKPQLVN